MAGRGGHKARHDPGPFRHLHINLCHYVALKGGAGYHQAPR
jgi:hypothetical protein